jgi:hypothetical protein
MSVTSMLTRYHVLAPIDHIIIRHIFTLAHKLNLKEPSSSGWLALPSLNEIASVEKALDSEDVFIMFDRWRDAVQEAETGETVVVRK